MEPEFDWMPEHSANGSNRNGMDNFDNYCCYFMLWLQSNLMEIILIVILCFRDNWDPFCKSIQRRVSYTFQKRKKENPTPMDVAFRHILRSVNQAAEWRTLSKQGVDNNVIHIYKAHVVILFPIFLPFLALLGYVSRTKKAFCISPFFLNVQFCF